MEGQLVELTEEELKWTPGERGLLSAVWTRIWRDRMDGFSSRIPVVKGCLGSICFRAMFLPFHYHV